MKRRDPPSHEQSRPAKVFIDLLIATSNQLTNTKIQHAYTNDGDDQLYTTPVSDLPSCLDLPSDVLDNIITYLQFDELLLCSVVCKSLNELADRRCRDIIKCEWKSNTSDLALQNGIK